MPPIVPLVLHHGAQGWRAPVAFEELYAGPAAALEAFGDHLPRFRFVLNDLSSTPDEVLRAGAQDAVVRLLFKHYLAGDLPDRLVEWSGLLRQVLAEGTSGLRAVQRVVEYLLQATEVPIEVLDRVLSEHVSPTMSEMIQTTADRLLAEGRAQGRAEADAAARADERAAAVLRILAARDIDVPASERERIRSCRDLDALDRWFDRALRVSAFAALFDGDE